MKISGVVKSDGNTVITATFLPEEMCRILALTGLLTGCVFAGRNIEFDNAITVVTGIMEGKCPGTEFEMVLVGR